MVAGLRVLGVESGLPLLPDLEFAIFERERPDAAAAALTAVLVSLGQTSVRPSELAGATFRAAGPKLRRNRNSCSIAPCVIRLKSRLITPC
jgi:hypothetical protein